MFILVFALVCFIFLLVFIKLISYERKYKRAPRLTVFSTVVEKRMVYSRSMNLMECADYYATFEVESGDRLVLHLDENEFGLLLEGDYGLLTFQGDKFCDFVRKTR